MKKFIIIALLMLPVLVMARTKKQKIVVTEAVIETMKDAGMVEGELTFDIGRKAAKPRQIIELRPVIYNGNEAAAKLTPLMIYGRSARIFETQRERLDRYMPYYATYPRAVNHSVCEYAASSWYNGEDDSNLSFVIEKWLRYNGKAKFVGYILVKDNDVEYIDLKAARHYKNILRLKMY